VDTPAAMLQRVAGALRPLDSVLGGAEDSAPLTVDEQAYLEFYRIDFAARIAGVQHALGFVESGGQRLAVHVLRSLQARGVLLLVHGYLDHVGLFGHLIRYGLERGYTVIAFDLPGHGLSTGDRVAIDDFGDYRRALESVQAACKSLPGTWRVIAQSTGGAAVLDYLVQHRGGFEKVVMLAPLVRPRGWFWVLPAHVVLHRFTDSVRRKFAENSSDQEFLDRVQTDPLQSAILSTRWVGALRRWIKSLPTVQVQCCVPVAIIQGDADETVDWRYNVKRIMQLISGTRVEYVLGGRHHLANESQVMRQQMYALMDEFFA
jgi:alpha-beta hydrolase superfamily lysophospholipase